MNGFFRRSTKGILNCAVTGAGDERVITKETKKPHWALHTIRPG